MAPLLDVNALHYGDNLDVLRDRDLFPSDSVDLVYLDPPFNSERGYNVIFKTHEGAPASAQIEAFDDTWEWGDEAQAQYKELTEGSTLPHVADVAGALFKILGKSDLFAYLVMMLPRLVELRRVLKPTGSLYLHCDPAAGGYLKVALDAVFGPEKFRSEITWKRSSAHSDTKQGRKIHGHIHDTIFFYTKGEEWTWNPTYTPYDKEYVEAFYKYTDEGTGRRYRLDNLTAAKPGGDVSYVFHGTRPYVGRYWAYSRENMEKFLTEGRIYFPKNNGTPSYKRYLDEMPGVPLQDVWNDIKPVGAQADERLGYPTQKPLALLERIIRTSSNEGDVVLDPFCGCGTTIEAAQRLKREWIGIDVTYIAIDLIQKRLAGVFGADMGPIDVRGIPRDLQGAKALFDRNPFDFERWAVSLVDGQPNAKQVGDRGIDGIVQFPFGPDETGRALVSVKGGESIAPTFVRDLLGTVDTGKAHMGILILRKPPTPGMVKAAADAGAFTVPVLGRSFPKIQILTIADLLDPKGARANMPTPFMPYIKARYNATTQLPLLPDGPPAKRGR